MRERGMALTSPIAEEGLLDLRQVCEFFGGKGAPFDPSTIYRGIKRGIYPKPFKASLQNNRWKLSECQAALQVLQEKSTK